MKTPARLFLHLPIAVAAALALTLSAVAAAHGSTIGDIEITHPFAPPNPPGTTNAAVYFAELENGGAQADKLVHASTPLAASVELHSMNVDAQGVMRMREVESIALAPKSSVKVLPGSGFHLMLVGLKHPLKDGDTFPMSLQFERAGKVEVKVVVQTPRAGAGAMADMHMH